MEEFVSKILIAEDASSLELLQAIYRSPYAPLHTRMRAAIAALPFEAPKLAVVAHLPENGRFAEQLEKALARSKPVLELRANGQRYEVPPPEQSLAVQVSPVAVRRR